MNTKSRTRAPVGCGMFLPSFVWLAAVPVLAQTIVIPHPPIASLVTVGAPDEGGFTRVTGAPGAVEPDSLVAVGCLDTATLDVVQAEPDGNFDTTIYAPPGTFILVKHAYPWLPLEEVRAAFGGTVPGDQIASWVNATSGVILPVPILHDGSNDGEAFALAGSIDSESGVGFWTFEGIQTREDRPTEVLIAGRVRVTTPAIQPGMDLSGIQGRASFNLYRFFDRSGRQVPVDQGFVSDFLTPTGLPILRSTPNGGPISESATVTDWRQVDDDVLEGDLSAVLTIPRTTRSGIYRPRLSLLLTGIPLGPYTDSSSFAMRQASYGGGFLPLVRIGRPAPPRLLATLLTDTLNEGTRGTMARRDRASFGLSPLTVFQTDDFVIPRVDPRTGQPISYRLEPFLPLIALTDRGLPNAPLIPFRLPSGSLEVVVRGPRRTVRRLGPAPFQQAVSASPAYPDAKLRDNDGGAMQDVYQLTTLDEAFDYAFTRYGRHRIVLHATVDDIWGNTYRARARYNLYVARPLEIYPGMLPTTPFQVGDVFAPQIQIYPRVPADIELRFRLFVDSDRRNVVERVVEGRANAFGYFHPGDGFEPIVMSGPGEYRVDLQATHRSVDGTIWANGATWGGVVETPDSPLIAHGRRGLDVPEVQPVPWFIHSQFVFNDVAHTYFPYYSGDVFWGTDSDLRADSIIPWTTIQDPSGWIYDLIRERWDDYSHSALFPWETLDARLAIGEAPLVSTTSDGTDLLWSPRLVDQYGYAYRSSQRPGARVHETVSEDELGIGYWRFGATYGDQTGVEGDLPNDLKWEFGGSVFRHLPENIHNYAIYGSLWVLIPEDDPLGGRVMPPFQGAAGGPSGGPLLTLQGRDIDLFFLPRSGRPGQILELGDVLSFSGHVAPPLDSKLRVIVTSPTGRTRTIVGQANEIGYFYEHEHDFIVDEPGRWIVEVQAVHDGETSAGPVQPPYPTGDVLGSDAGRYAVYVVPSEASPLELEAPEPDFLEITASPIPPVEIVGRVPEGAGNTTVHYTIAMPGFILEQGTLAPSGDTFTVTYDPETLHKDFPNLDLTAFDANRPGLADQIWISILLSDDSGHHHARSVTLHGEQILTGDGG